jgi:histidine triad (HIT) family protein
VSSCVFCRIASGELPAELQWQDDEVVAFPDAHPQAPTHVLVIPKRHIASSLELGSTDANLVGHLTGVAVLLARRLGLGEEGRGFRIVLNTGPDGGQSVAHLHLHLLGGRSLGWPPG